MVLNLHISEDKTNEKKWGFGFYHLMLLQLTVQASRLHRGGIQKLQLVQPSSMTTRANLNCNPNLNLTVSLIQI